MLIWQTICSFSNCIGALVAALILATKDSFGVTIDEEVIIANSSPPILAMLSSFRVISMILLVSVFRTMSPA